MKIAIGFRFWLGMLACGFLLSAGCVGQGKICAPGGQQDCDCGNGSQGVATCNDDGKAWGECRCMPESDAGPGTDATLKKDALFADGASGDDVAQAVDVALVDGGSVDALLVDHGSIDGPDSDAGSGDGATDSATSDAILDASEDVPRVVYDPLFDVYWLANANLAGSAAMREQLGVADSGINANGTMDYPTAEIWVQALNAYNDGHGYLGHKDWQLPTTAPTDDTCAVPSGPNDNSFGPSCTGSALGSLYSLFLGRVYPESVVTHFVNTVGPFKNLQAALYWSSTAGADAGQGTFSFNTGLVGQNTTKHNFFHVVARRQGAVDDTPPSGTGLVPYSTGPAAGKAVYDTVTGLTWLLDANLAAQERFGVSGITSIQGADGGHDLTVPKISASGAMLYATTTEWVQGLKDSQYAGASDWELPTRDELQTLFERLGLQAGDPRMAYQGFVDLFENLQPFFYWSCARNQDGGAKAPCNGQHAAMGPNGVTPMEWGYNLDIGFQGTDKNNKQFYVMVYYPAKP